MPGVTGTGFGNESANQIQVQVEQQYALFFPQDLADTNSDKNKKKENAMHIKDLFNDRVLA